MNAEEAGLPLGEGPLRGLVVIDVTRVVAGPYCTMMLADLGATVIKVENPAEPDYVRSFPPFVQGDHGRASAFFAQYNRHKLGISLNLKTSQGQALLRKLIGKADMLVENFRPGTMAKMGLDYEALKAENPRLVYVSISGFGQTGPHSLRPAYDNSAQATGGLWSFNGEKGRPPVRVGTIIGDLSASFYATIAALAAIMHARQTGEGQLVDVAQQDSVVTLTEHAVVNYTVDQIVAEPLGNDHPFVRPYGQLACKDGFVFFGAYTDKFWREACRIFGEPGLIADPEIDTMEKRFDPQVYERRVAPIVRRWCAHRTKAELEDMAGDVIPLTPIKTMAEVVEDPHLAAREMFVPVVMDGVQVKAFGSPMKLSKTPVNASGAAPSFGEHNTLVFRLWAGLSAGELGRLCAEGVI
ncbi:CaiB/BaiF CoA transferase family protein [Pollutimonas bauzanensis]|uniref:Crotonobetainyl-CoA:carnitine CoA-transferase CaiB n=1 Tax=Pollutimonas bauzanensis TaxID=658167 RepID=A0A1M5Q7U8_9BURK|nr:CoA transferase [Pollutimonas bauzanensis]SHH09839.1 Crotonobetainyl-CoA:carnitine CoA-transferase CaiB [Pollutimonas bauzanensis]